MKIMKNELVERDSLFYKKFTDVPFTGTTTGSIQATFKNGKVLEGPWVECFTDGVVWKRGTYKDGQRDGPWVEYGDDGELREKGDYKNGKRDGSWVIPD